MTVAHAATDDEPNPMFWYNYGNALRHSQRLDEALEVYKKALAASRTDPYPDTLPPEKVMRIHNNLGVTYRNLGNAALAEQHWLEALAVDSGPAAMETTYNLVVLWHAQGSVAEAIALLDSLPWTEADPRLQSLRANLTGQAAP